MKGAGATWILGGTIISNSLPQIDHLLAGIVENAGLALEELAESHAARPLMEQILEDGERAAGLIRLMAEPEHLSEQPTTDEAQASKGLVLIIDDEEIVRTTSRLTLERDGYGVIEAENGEAGVGVFERAREAIRLVLLDLSMPVTNGEGALERIRQIRPDVPVLVISGLGEGDVRRRLAGEDLAGFLQKPFTAAKLRYAVKAALGTFAAMGGG